MKRLSRRNFLQSAALAPAAAFAPLELFRSAQASTSDLPSPYVVPPRGYFTKPEMRFVEAAVARIFPKDDLGPGALEAGVAVFIDRQLAGPYGRAETWYMRGPWHEGTKEQGYQSKLTPAQLYRAAIRNIDDYARKQHGNKVYADLDPDAQDQILSSLEKDDIKLPDVPAKTFFKMIVQNTTEGFFADPMYGGNRDFIGWKLIGFPGPRYNYVAEIDQYGKKYEMPFVSLNGHDAGVAKG